MTALAAPSSTASPRARVRLGLRLLATALLITEGAVHIQQLIVLFHSVPWIGPLFAINAGVCTLIAIWVLARDSPLAYFAGIGVAAGALIGLALSYTVGLFGWKEVGIRPAIEIAIASETAALAVLTYLLASDRRWVDDLRARIYVLRHADD